MIRPATINDTVSITNLALLLWPNHCFDELKKVFEALFANQNAFIAVYFDAENPVGFAQCQMRFDYVEGAESSPVGYLEGIFVREQYRKQGIAKKLIHHCEIWAKGRGCVEFASDCELTNTDSLRFHLSVGFIEANRIICFNKRL